jgi:Papain family cysteine protease
MGMALSLVWASFTRCVGRALTDHSTSYDTLSDDGSLRRDSSEGSCPSSGDPFPMRRTPQHLLEGCHSYEVYCATPRMGHPHHNAPLWPCGNVSVKPPPSTDLRPLLLPPRNQSEQSACFAFAACSMREWQEAKETGTKRYLSPQFVYDNRGNSKDEDRDNDEGMWGYDVMKILKEVGVVPETVYPYGRPLHATDIPTSIIRMAYKLLIYNFASVTTIEGLKLALNNNGPCIICVPVYDPDTPTMWRKQHEAAPLLGGHAMTVVGYNDKGFIVRNSWGPTWNGNGHVRFDYKDWGLQWEIWTTIDAKD